MDSNVDLAIGVLFGLGLYGLYLVFKCRFQVAEGHLAVLSEFGKCLYSDESNQKLRTFGPGFHLKRPWQQVHSVSMMEQMLELSGEDGGTTAMAADGTMLRFDSVVRFTPLASHVYDYLFGLERPVDHVKSLFVCLLRNEIANFDGKFLEAKSSSGTSLVKDALPPGSYAIIRRERRLLNQSIQEFCRHQIGDRYGVNFDGIDLTDILPPDELAEALNSVINAHSEAQSLFARTEGECEQQLIAAAKGLDIAKVRASAVEIEIDTMVSILARLQRDGTLKSYLDRRRAEVYTDARTSYVKRPS